MHRVVSLVFIWFVCINLFALFALNRFNLSPDTAYTWINPQEFFQDQNLDLVNLRVHWDSFWYLKIVEKGYQYEVEKMSSIAFFPLYPLLIWILAQFFIPPVLGGWVISSVALAVAMIFLHKLVKQFHPGINPLEPVVLSLIFPTAFFFNAVYTESLFLALSIIFFYCLFKKQFLLAAVFLSLASLCRLNGLFLLVPFAYEYFKVHGSKIFNKNLLSLPLSLLGILLFMFYQYILFNEPLAFLKSQMQWGRNFVPNLGHFQLITSASYANLATDLLFFAVALIYGIVLLKKIRISYGLYVLTSVLVALSTGTLMSISRFVLILFPIFILIASVKNREFKFGYILLSVLLLASFTISFVSNYWAG